MQKNTMALCIMMSLHWQPLTCWWGPGKKVLRNKSVSPISKAVSAFFPLNKTLGLTFQMNNICYSKVT